MIVVSAIFTSYDPEFAMTDRAVNAKNFIMLNPVGHGLLKITFFQTSFILIESLERVRHRRIAIGFVIFCIAAFWVTIFADSALDEEVEKQLLFILIGVA